MLALPIAGFADRRLCRLPALPIAGFADRRLCRSKWMKERYDANTMQM
jgi:hypothetical protein